MQDIANKRRSNKYCHGPINYIMIKFYISCLAIATLLLFLGFSETLLLFLGLRPAVNC